MHHMYFVLAQNVSSEFLLDPIKLLILFATALVASGIVSKLVSDIHRCGLPCFKWHGILIGGLVAGFFAGLFIPTICSNYLVLKEIEKDLERQIGFHQLDVTQYRLNF